MWLRLIVPSDASKENNYDLQTKLKQINKYIWKTLIWNRLHYTSVNMPTFYNSVCPPNIDYNDQQSAIVNSTIAFLMIFFNVP